MMNHLVGCVDQRQDGLMALLVAEFRYSHHPKVNSKTNRLSMLQKPKTAPLGMVSEQWMETWNKWLKKWVEVSTNFKGSELMWDAVVVIVLRSPNSVTLSSWEEEASDGSCWCGDGGCVAVVVVDVIDVSRSCLEKAEDAKASSLFCCSHLRL